jgi:hypothetical protein
MMKTPYQTPPQRPCHAILRRLSPKLYDWQSDFVGELLTENGLRHQIGVTIRTGHDGQQELSLYARPLHLYKTSVTPRKLEVVR